MKSIKERYIQKQKRRNSERKREREREYLSKHIFYGLGDRNTGYDVGCIAYFSEQDFEIVLERIKQMGIGVYGIEPWQNGNFYDVRSCPSDMNCTDSEWYMKTFQEFKERGEILDYAASYYVPKNLLEE